MKTLLKEWPGSAGYCRAKSSETCFHWSLSRVSRKIGSQHMSVKYNLETFCEGLAGVVEALCLSPDFWVAPLNNLGSAVMGVLWFTPKTEATPRHLRDSRDHGWQYGAIQLPPAPVNLGRWQAWFHPICLGEIYVVISSPHVTVWLKNSPDGPLFAVASL